MSSKTNPNGLGGDAGEYAGFKAPRHPDASTVGGAAGSFYSGSNEQGNQVKAKAINKTLNQGSTTKTSAKPAGPVTGSGY